MPFRPYTMWPHAAADTQSASYTLNQIRSIYSFPPPVMVPMTVSIISFGGGLIGTFNSAGLLTSGDVINHWTALGIPITSQPKVIVIPVGGIIPNGYASDNATIENTLNIQTIGALCPNPNITIIINIAYPTSSISSVLRAALRPVGINGVAYAPPSIISCSWGCPESYMDPADIIATEAILKNATQNGLTFTVATGNLGSSNGTGSSVADYPSASPYSVACGGTTLFCNNAVYDASTSEVVWSGSGGGFSRSLAKLAYQRDISGAYRSTPDVAMNADPNTGVIYTIGGRQRVIGGTSIVAPAVAAFAAAINLKQFMTPLLYTAPNIFNDIKSGSNGAYAGIVGYDNCSGLGSPNYGLLRAALLPAVVQVTGITLPGIKPSSLLVGETYHITHVIHPVNATDKTVTFTSSNATIASVSATGLVTALKQGSAIISVTTTDGAKKVTLPLSILLVPVSGVTLESPSSAVIIGSSYQCIYSVLPPNATNKAVTFTSSNNAVARVNAAGLVTTVAGGVSTITVVTSDRKFSATAALTVTTIPVSYITILSATPLTLSQDQSSTLSYSVNPTNATKKTVIFSSSNPSVATVSSTGMIKAVVAGSTTITIASGDGAASSSIPVTVIQTKVSSISINGTPPPTLFTGQTYTISYTIQPTTAVNKAVTFRSSNPAVATVSSAGVITGKTPGTVTVTVTTTDGRYTAKFDLTVIPVFVSNMALSAPSTTIKVNSATKLSATIGPANATNKTVVWSSNSPSVLITQTGSIKGMSKGTAVITARSGDGNASTTMTIQVV